MEPYQESQKRSLLKALSWRVTGTLATALIVYLLTGRLDFAAAAGSLDFISKIALYFVHERAWNQITQGRKRAEPSVIWMTGLSGAGKTTIALALTERLRVLGIPVEHLDGDTIRDIFPNTGFSKKERIEHLNRVGFLASRLERNGVFVVASLISPYKESRDFVRKICHHFLEVYISTPLSECEKRDPKGLYKKARSGELKNFTGVSDPYEPPQHPELTINAAEISLDAAVDLILKKIK